MAGPGISLKNTEKVPPARNSGLRGKFSYMNLELKRKIPTEQLNQITKISVVFEGLQRVYRAGGLS